MSETETTVPMDSQALFDAAIAPEAPAEVAPAGQPQGETTEQKHDPVTGRFLPKTEETSQVQAPAEQPQAQQPVVQEPPKVEAKQEPPPGWIPAWRAREIADAKTRSLEEQLRKLTEKPAEPVDPYVDPQKFRDQGIEQATAPLVQQLNGTREYFSRKLAIASYGQETVQEAFTWLQTAAANGDPKAGPILQRAMNSIDPFEEIVSGYKRDKALSTVGDDPQAWFQKQLQEAAKDPAKRQELMQLLGGEQPDTQQPQTNIVKLPPSLNRQPGTQVPSNAGMNDADLYRAAIS